MLLGLLILVWLSIEDRNELFVVIAAGAVCTWLAARFLINSPESDTQLILRHGLVGIFGGLLIAPIAILLMAVKSGIHGHSIPDFSVSQMQSVLLRTPYYLLSGFLIALGIGIWRMVKRSDIEEQEDN